MTEPFALGSAPTGSASDAASSGPVEEDFVTHGHHGKT